MMSERNRSRRFPRPWTTEDNGACFIVKDRKGQALAYVSYEEEPGRRAAANLLTRDEARRIAANIARLPELSTARRQREALRELLVVIRDSVDLPEHIAARIHAALRR